MNPSTFINGEIPVLSCQSSYVFVLICCMEVHDGLYFISLTILSCKLVLIQCRPISCTKALDIFLDTLFSKIYVLKAIDYVFFNHAIHLLKL
jgi:hypothetical protein